MPVKEPLLDSPALLKFTDRFHVEKHLQKEKTDSSGCSYSCQHSFFKMNSKNQCTCQEQDNRHTDSCILYLILTLKGMDMFLCQSFSVNSLQFSKRILLYTHLRSLLFQFMDFSVQLFNGTTQLLFFCKIFFIATLHLYLISLT